jgi:hypothetical protein
MNELDHIKHRYKGSPGEQVTITITPTGTVSLVNFTLDGVAGGLPAGTPLRFNLKNVSGAMTPLQLDLDFTALGTYEIVVEKVVDCVKDAGHTNKCIHTRQGPPRVIENYKFFVA